MGVPVQATVVFVGIGSLVYFGSVYYKNSAAEQDELIFVNTLCRHGARNRDPAETFPRDPWKDEKYWKGGLGQLTNLGKQQHYHLGRYFRERYANLLGEDGNILNNIYVQSTLMNRTIDSAKANLEGFFSVDANSSKRYDWQSVPVHTLPKEDEYVLGPLRECNYFDYVMIQYENTTAYKSLFEKNRDVIKYVEIKTGRRLRTLKDIFNVYYALVIQQHMNYRLPNWAEKVMKHPSRFVQLGQHFFDVFTATTEMKRMRSGFLLRDILHRFADLTQSQDSSQDFSQDPSQDPSEDYSEDYSQDPLQDARLRMYFSHDITISSLLNTLGVFQLHSPPYASCVLFELYRTKDADLYVQIFYRNTTATDIPPIEIPNCGTKCPLSQMFELYDDVLPIYSIDEECALGYGQRLPKSPNPEDH